MNLIDLTSSRRDDRTNAYTERILSVEGNIFSSCVRSENLTRIVVCVYSAQASLTRDRRNAHSAIDLSSTSLLPLAELELVVGHRLMIVSGHLMLLGQPLGRQELG